MSGKDFVIDRKSHRAQILNYEYCRGACVALAERMYLPQIGCKTAYVAYYLVCRESAIIEQALLFQVVFYGTLKVGGIHIVHGVASEHPFAFGNVIIANLPCVLEYALKYVAMHLGIAKEAEGKRVSTQQFGYIGSHTVGFLLVFIGFVVRLTANIIGVDKLFSLVNRYFALNIF